MSYCKEIIKTLFVTAVTLLLGASSATGNPLEISQFISPEICGRCHGQIFNQWKNSMHNLAHKDPVYLAVSKFVLTGLTDSGEIAEAESCVKCHTPVGHITGYPKKSSDDRQQIPKIATHGIQCDYCHSATGAKKMYNNDLNLSPGNGVKDPGIKRGPFKDAASRFHQTQFSEFHTSAKICGTCHNVKHVVFDTDLETTYEEWEKGPYNSPDPESRVVCQECHMYQRPGIPATGSTKRPKNPGRAAIFGPQRDHIFTHYFVGANRLVTGIFDDQVKVKMAEARLKNSASLSIDTSQIKDGEIKIRIKNTGAGHYLPTGLTNVRQMWLEITVRDEKEKVVYMSGKLDEKGYVPEGATIFNTVFGDGKGNAVLNIAKAREVLEDKRIPPLKTVEETVSIPKEGWKNLKVNARLLYRSAPQKVLDIILGDGKLQPSVIIMEEVETTI